MRKGKRKATIFTGSRHWIDRLAVARVLDKVKPDVVIEGGADGLDTIVRWECLERDILCETFEADWARFKLRAGPKRNYDMLDRLLEYQKQGYEIEVHAFPRKDSKGTAHMMKIADYKEIEVFKHTSTNPRVKHRRPHYRQLLSGQALVEEGKRVREKRNGK